MVMLPLQGIFIDIFFLSLLFKTIFYVIICFMKFYSKINKNHGTQEKSKTGVLLVNLGTPESLNYTDMRKYLGEFLSDVRVVEKPKWFWLPLLQLVLLQIIPFRSAKKYALIWDYERGESPLRTITRDTSFKLRNLLKDEMENASIEVEWAFRYGQPSIENALRILQDKGCNNIKLLPLYPQYAGATWASVCDKAYDVLKTFRYMPTLEVVEPYYKHEAYIKTLANSVTAGLGKVKPTKLVFSFHGLPKACFEKGDPYPVQCHKTAKLVAKELNWNDDMIVVTFQSRFGNDEWLKPYTDFTLKELAEDGVKDIAVITPGFAADCIETLEEIAITNKEVFMNAGGENYTFIPCLNSSDEAIDMYKNILGS